MAEIHENFKYRVQRFGVPRNASPLTLSQLERFKSTFPRSFYVFVKTYGLGSFFDGLYTMCDPERLRPVLALVFKGDKEFSHKECHVLAYTAFGVLWCWSERLGTFEIDLPAGMVFCRALTGNQQKADPISAENAITAIIPLSEDDADYSDYLDEPLYSRCKDTLGSLEEGECYGFFPALAVAGIFSPMRSVNNIKRVRALEHFTFLAQIDDFYLTRVGPLGFEAVRSIG